MGATFTYLLSREIVSFLLQPVHLIKGLTEKIHVSKQRPIDDDTGGPVFEFIEIPLYSDEDG